MPTWSDILGELVSRVPPGAPPPFDEVRREYLLRYSDLVGRDVILYATSWTHGTSDSVNLGITEEDIHAFMEVTYGLQCEKLDLVIHSPGGSIEAVEAIVTYLRTKFEHIRAVVPQVALSAATMLACACDEIVMAKHSFLGPIDPQIPLQTNTGFRLVAVHNIEQQFDMAMEAISKNPEVAVAWYSILGQYGPDLLNKCKLAKDLSSLLVEQWLATRMLRDEPEKAKTASCRLGNHGIHLAHGRHLSREYVKQELGFPVTDLESDQAVQDALLSVFHAAMLTFSSCGTVKIVENSKGRTYAKLG